MKHKSCKAQFKAIDEDAGTFEAVVSVFGNVDLGGDRVVKGAFTKSLARWKESGDPIPVVWSHMWNDPHAHIGKVLEAEERDEGLWVKAQQDMDDPFAAKVFKLLKERRVKEFSFAYDVVKEAESDGANELQELEVIEVGPTLKGMNPETQLLAAKAYQDVISKAYVALEGSHEERGRALRVAVRGWVAETFPDPEDGESEEAGRAFGWVEATFDDRVIVAVDDFRDPEASASKQYEIDYEVDDDGNVTLGEAREVQIVGAVQPKSRRKSGRVLSAKNEKNLRTARDLIADVLKQLESSQDSDKSKTKTAQEPTRAIRSTQDHLSLLLELEALEAS